MFKFICFNILFLFSIVIKASNEEGKENNNMKLDPVFMNCTFCHKPISTTVTQSFDCCAFSLCCLSLCIPYIIVQSCRGKDFMPYKGTHTCPYCGNVVGTYDPL